MSNQNKAEMLNSKSSQIMSIVSLKNLEIDELNLSGSKVGFSLAIRSLLQNWRQGTVACKGRAEVNRTNRKPWKQKGTGRARAGSARSPLWRGGGVIFGPQERVKTLRITKQTKKRVFGALLSDFANKEKIVCLDWTLEGDVPKTKLAYSLLKSVNFENSNVTLFLSITDFATRASFINIPRVRILFFDQPNAFQLVNTHYWVFLKKDSDQFKEMVSQWV
ncbi:MAG TPA: 50S ribosomal protein L4 [Candidatus Babeliales bacterium]|nr:50S ribosomal protein L4 [Candidatus Babeliales bacterium]